MTTALRSIALSIVLCLGLALLALVPVSKADTVTYNFTGSSSAPGGDGLSFSFQYSSNGFITPDPQSGFFTLFASQLNSCTNCYVSTSIPSIYFSDQGPGIGAQIDFTDVQNFLSVFGFPSGALNNAGTYTSSDPYNSGTLNVSVVSTPEPATILLLGIGFGFLMLLFRKPLAVPGAGR